MKAWVRVVVRGGVIQPLWVEQFWNLHPRKLEHEIFEDGPSAKIESLENFWLYSIRERHHLVGAFQKGISIAK